MVTNLDLNVKFTRKGFEEFCMALNHRLTKIETDVRWMRRIGYYMATVVTAIGIKFMIGG
jgi:hypothetical protein